MKLSRALISCAALLMFAAMPSFAQAPAGTMQGPGGAPPAGAPGGGGRGPQGPGMALTTTAFPDGGEIPAKYTMSVPNPVSPDLKWTNAPPNVVSFVLILHDPDTSVMRKTDDILHWMVFNIPGTATGLAEGVPAGPTLADGSVQIKNLRGNPAYMGPGAGAAGPFHHYTFELFALDIKLDLGPDATRPDILAAMNGHILRKAVLVGRFHL
jgi:Raf kinase inhibitor-like YbhB/YbcL family protein